MVVGQGQPLPTLIWPVAGHRCGWPPTRGRRREGKSKKRKKKKCNKTIEDFKNFEGVINAFLFRG